MIAVESTVILWLRAVDGDWSVMNLSADSHLPGNFVIAICAQRAYESVSVAEISGSWWNLTSTEEVISSPF